MRNEHIKEKRRREGLCPQCGQEPVPGHTMCRKHLDDNNRRSRERSARKDVTPHIQKQRRALGLCPYCGNEPVPGKAMCKEHAAKASAYSLAYQQANGYKETSKRRLTNRTWYQQQKQGKECLICGENNPVCLDFHHRNPAEKSFQIGRVANVGGRSREAIEAELAKCDLLCANCHRKVHWGDKEYGATSSNDGE